ncbi:histone acetyltransferase NGF-1 [Coprinopsis cinerea okayama7|uniref:Histone acetyltransferase NGF-1 n=1 Tax=Coprinopsis cinerea (strain Okayama-7 / 130 / ATCC MYA-4618 / FGSC 9003) TaxID=240176 RepID=A8N782_COPC7|nr:histone acetyltransferase NGF-1 [Coprinopsis cinerea okayama7\|eukprot:XP_001830688.2 histone acetyltransferase NGF-1 [Coprinopsis cinerea okayama7\
MKLAYPTGSDIFALHNSLLAVKIARHSPCAVCSSSCQGMHPPKGVRIVMDVQDESSGVDDYSHLFNESDDEDDGIPASGYLEICACGHDCKSHHADEDELGKREFKRRAALAIRMDELLKDSGRLLDFEYTDDDINNLRKQMVIPYKRESISPGKRLPIDPVSTAHITYAERRQSVPLSSPASSSLSELDPSSALSGRKRRASTSSLSEAVDDPDPEENEDDDSDEEEDKPLASRLLGANAPGRSVLGKAKRTTPSKRSRSGKAGGKKAKRVHTIASDDDDDEDDDKPHGQVNGVNGHKKVKEEKAEAAVLADATAARPVVPTGQRAEKISSVELRRGVIQVVPVKQDGEPRSLIILTGLKTLFQKQLPVMPREYISRLVYDDNSRSLAIIKRGYKVVGGICFRPFPHRGFAEIVFFATNSADQEKGYGGMLMDYFKAHIRKEYPDMNHFLTYADNYAVGYFEKQGFTKEITLDKSVWAGYIKDYEGGTIMQCTMIPKVDYLEKKRIFNEQHDAILEKIRQMSRAHIVYPGLPQFQPGQPEGVTVDPRDVPGLRESGWTPEMDKELRNLKSPDHHLMEKTLATLRADSHAWPFQTPVTIEAVPDYFDVIKHPMGKHDTPLTFSSCLPPT